MGTRDDAGDAALDGGPPDGMAGVAAVDPFLTGAWEPVHDELDVDDLPVTGEIPDALAGSYVRNGPNPALAPEGRYHVFDGDGMLHAVRFEGGPATGTAGSHPQD